MNLCEGNSVEELNAHSANSAAGHCGIRVEAIGDNWVEASMPIDARTCGQDGAVTIGALSILAESVGSLAASIAVDRDRAVCLGQTLQVSQLAKSKSGPVRAKATPVDVNDVRHLWRIEIVDARQVTIANAQLATVVLKKEEVPP